MSANIFRGLKPATETLVMGTYLYTELVFRIYPDGRRELMSARKAYRSNVVREPSGEQFLGLFDEPYPLSIFHFEDGTVLYERVQTATWGADGHLTVFTALQREDRSWVEESLWSPEEQLSKP